MHAPNPSQRLLRLALWSAALAFVSACQAPPVPEAFRDETLEAEAYRIGASDVLAIRVWKNPELSVEAPVLPDGTVSVPLAGAVSATGLTCAELEDLLAEHLAEYIAAPEVSVTVMQANSRRVSVVGEVNRPGWVPLTATTRVMDAISSAGSFSVFANRKKVKVIRHTPNGDVEFRFNYDAYVAGRAPGHNIRLQSGDTIVVPD